MKPCVDDKLDDFKRRQNGLPDLLNVVTEEEIARLPREVGTTSWLEQDICLTADTGEVVSCSRKMAGSEAS